MNRSTLQYYIKLVKLSEMKSPELKPQINDKSLARELVQLRKNSLLPMKKSWDKLIEEIVISDILFAIDKRFLEIDWCNSESKISIFRLVLHAASKERRSSLKEKYPELLDSLEDELRIIQDTSSEVSTLFLSVVSKLAIKQIILRK